MEEVKVPGKVSWRVIDAWKAIPPCTYIENPYCHIQCPYINECYPELFEDNQ